MAQDMSQHMMKSGSAMQQAMAGVREEMGKGVPVPAKPAVRK